MPLADDQKMIGTHTEVILRQTIQR